MKLRRITLISLSCLMAAVTDTRAQQRGPSTTQERQRAVETAKLLQADPLAANIQQDREWLIQWLIQIPDISVKMCPPLLGELGDSKSGYPCALVATMLASEAAFVIEHPEKSKDLDSVYLAGVDGAIRGYESIHKKDNSYRLPHLDDLIQKRDQGTLPEYVHGIAKKCSK